MTTLQTASNSRSIKVILLAGLLTGFLDGIAAVTHHVAIGGNNPIGIFKFIASCLIGKSAHSAGFASTFLGVVIHFAIATFFAAVYFFIYPHLKKLSGNKILNGCIYGIFVWIVMSYGILHLVILKAQVQLNSAIVGILIHIFCVGLPISLLVDNYYNKNL